MLKLKFSVLNLAKIRLQSSFFLSFFVCFVINHSLQKVQNLCLIHVHVSLGYCINHISSRLLFQVNGISSRVSTAKLFCQTDPLLYVQL